MTVFVGKAMNDERVVLSYSISKLTPAWAVVTTRLIACPVVTVTSEANAEDVQVSAGPELQAALDAV